ncbi:DUF4417 domain-containing protein [Varibaculum cambriense]|uniref:DUF4417 domain-containing protein n=1 Tax=Varibaculum cambriense TaxID=184870 RepID=A0ABX4UNI1_9ACTO|nr:DUF4417 domain-containing protein [Varibaculum cambriense]PMB89263.1 hypothetical protein CJ240_05715 [Varibaculum cambriense]
MLSRTIKTYNLHLHNPKRVTGKYDIPTLTPVDTIPEDLIPFNYLLTSSPDKRKAVHFFLDDYQFERCWKRPYKYLNLLSGYQAVLTPDFSLYLDMPKALKIWNTYRSRLIGQYWQNQGLTVIPTVSWAEPDSYKYAFDGLPIGATLAVSTVGVMMNRQSQKLWKQGAEHLLRTLHPKTLLIYGNPINIDPVDTELIYYQNFANKRLRNLTKDG